MNQKGSHVGVVISFVIFITFLLFLYIVFEPAIKTQKSKEPVLDNLKAEIIKEISAEMTSVSLEMQDVLGGNDIQFVNFQNWADLENLQVLVKDENGNDVGEFSSGSDLIIRRNDASDLFFKVYQSDEFELINTGTGAPIYYPNDYAFGLIRTKKYVFEKEIVSLLERYRNDYEILKEILRVPEDTEFGFDFQYNNKTAIGTGVGDLSTSVYVQEVPVEYVDEEANVLIGRLDLKAW